MESKSPRSTRPQTPNAKVGRSVSSTRVSVCDREAAWALQDSNLGASGYEPGALPLS
jgi:hypothetical protein